MKAVMHPNPNAPFQIRTMQAFAKGLKMHSIEVIQATNISTGIGDFDVIWSLNQMPVAINRPLILECGYINGNSGNYKSDRLRFIAPCWDKVHGLGLPQPPAPGDRWEKLGIDMPDWISNGNGYALVLMQNPNDRVVPSNYLELMQDAIDSLSGIGHEVRIRPHPLVAKAERSLQEDLAGASVAVTYSSTAGVEAILAGVPAITLGEISVAYPVSSHSIVDPLWRNDRTQWCHDFAYRQWTLDEFKTGEAWEWLNYALEADNRVSGETRGETAPWDRPC